MALHLDDHGRWPLWHPPVDTGAPVTDGYGQVACFVSPDALEGQPGLSAGVGAAVRRAATEPLGGIGRLIVERLYEQLRGCEVRYDGAPWEPGAGQRLRHPGWALSPRESATCVDFAILFAAMCLRERLAPFLVLMRGESGGAPVGHVMVGVDLDRGPESLTEAAPLAACAEEPSAGVSRVTGRDFLVEDPAVLLVDVTLASRDHRASLERAVACAAQALESPDYRDVHLVDVAVRQHEGDSPLSAPTGRATLRRRLPGPRHALETFPSRAGAAARLAALSTRMVVVGNSGVGKSEMARDAAARVDQGLGWFLTATNEAALVASLAEAELAEGGWEVGDLDNVDRSEFARSALNRLARADTPWVVVVDNADCAPAKLRRWLPVPDPAVGQVLIITTTNTEWRGESGEIINIDPLEPEEVEAMLGDERLVPLAAGRPLLVQAFLDASCYLGLSVGELRAQLITTAADLHELSGPWALWVLLRDKLPAVAAGAARALAWLLPDRTPLDVLAEAGYGADYAVQELLGAGLVGRPGARDPVVSLHRLFGSAIRKDLRAHNEDRAMVTRLLGVAAVCELLMVSADADITGQLAESLIDQNPVASPPRRDRGRGVALWVLGAMQEMHQGTATSAATFEHAMAYLDENEKEDRPLIADCLHGRARKVNQERHPSEGAVTQAREWMAHAIELRDETDVAGRSKHRALDGLLLQRHARDGLPFGSAEQVAGLREAQEILEQSWLERKKAAGVDQRLVDRAYFNRAGVRVDLAQRVTDEAVELLGVAEQVYRETLTFRSATYRDPHPLIAASYNGLATCLYYRAALDPHADRDAALVEATREAVLALEQRRVTDGDRDGNDAVKSASILAKIALARVRAVGDTHFTDLVADMDRELRSS